MKITRGLSNFEPPDVHSHVAVGVFDGVHIAHQQIIRTAVNNAMMSGGRSVVVTFDPHPQQLLNPKNKPEILTPLELKAELIETLGVDELLVLLFNQQFSQLAPDEFVKQVLVERLRAQTVVVGFNFTFGHLGKGNAEVLRELGCKFGFEVAALPPVEVQGVVVSSSEIRRLILEGRVDEASRLLGRPYLIRGKIVSGRGRGRALGFPTANMLPAGGVVWPKTGVYAVECEVRGSTWQGVANVGRRPTFEVNGSELLEVHLLDFSGDIYDESIGVRFISRIRDEVKYPNTESLIAQISRDISRARSIFQGSLH